MDLYICPYPAFTALIIVNFYCLNITLLAGLNKTNFSKLIEMIIFFHFFSMWFHVIQAIEVNIIHLLLDVSETSIVVLARIPAGRLWPTHIYFFSQAPAQIRPYSFHLFCSFQHFLQSYILYNLVVTACSQGCLFIIDFHNFLELYHRFVFLDIFRFMN